MKFTINEKISNEIIIKKSRFITQILPIKTRKEAKNIIDKLWLENPNASHICWALLTSNESAAIDDGEPSGTAGRPMLEVLRKQNLENVLVIVIRYFGGIKLGSGGLIRAYSESVALTLKKIEKIPFEKLIVQKLEFDYSKENYFRRELNKLNAKILEINHQEKVNLTFELSENKFQELKQNLNKINY